MKPKPKLKLNWTERVACWQRNQKWSDMKYHTCYMRLLLCYIYVHLNRTDRRTCGQVGGGCCVTLTAAQRLSGCPQLIVCLFNECLRMKLSRRVANQLNANINCKLQLQFQNATFVGGVGVGVKTWLSSGVIKMLESQMNLTKAAHQLTNGPRTGTSYWDEDGPGIGIGIGNWD